MRYLKEEHWNQRAQLNGPAEKKVCTHYFGTRELSWMHSIQDLDRILVSPDARERRLWTHHVVADSTEDISHLFEDMCCLSGVSSALSCATTKEHAPAASLADDTVQKKYDFSSSYQVMISFQTLFRQK
jgi:hypothetical protein